VIPISGSRVARLIAGEIERAGATAISSNSFTFFLSTNCGQLRECYQFRTCPPDRKIYNFQYFQYRSFENLNRAAPWPAPKFQPPSTCPRLNCTPLRLTIYIQA
jgi:hypothetical protein